MMVLVLQKEVEKILNTGQHNLIYFEIPLQEINFRTAISNVEVMDLRIFK